MELIPRGGISGLSGIAGGGGAPVDPGTDPNDVYEHGWDANRTTTNPAYNNVVLKDNVGTEPIYDSSGFVGFSLGGSLAEPDPPLSIGQKIFLSHYGYSLFGTITYTDEHGNYTTDIPYVGYNNNAIVLFNIWTPGAEDGYGINVVGPYKGDFFPKAINYNNNPKPAIMNKFGGTYYGISRNDIPPLADMSYITPSLGSVLPGSWSIAVEFYAGETADQAVFVGSDEGSGGVTLAFGDPPQVIVGSNSYQEYVSLTGAAGAGGAALLQMTYNASINALKVWYTGVGLVFDETTGDSLSDLPLYQVFWGGFGYIHPSVAVRSMWISNTNHTQSEIEAVQQWYAVNRGIPL